MPIISDSTSCIDGRSLDFKLIDKVDYFSQTPYGNRNFNQFEIYPTCGKEYIFICIAKTGSSSVNIRLNHTVHPEPKYHHMGISDVVRHYPNIDLSKYFKFAFVRNPWDRFVSLYNDMYHRRNGKCGVMNYSGLVSKKSSLFAETSSFKEFCLGFENSGWVTEPHHKQQYDLLSIDGEVKIDFCGKFENLNEDWGLVCRELNFPSTFTLGHHMKSAVDVKNYREWYDDETKEVVARVYEKDIENWAYEF